MKKSEQTRAAVIGGLAVVLIYLMLNSARKGPRVTPVPSQNPQPQSQPMQGLGAFPEVTGSAMVGALGGAAVGMKVMKRDAVSGALLGGALGAVAGSALGSRLR